MKRLFGALLCFLFWFAVARAEIPELEPGVYLQSGRGPLTVNYYTAPSVIDWNSDGKKDLLVGQFTGGYVWVFLNQGSDSQPAFTTGSQLRVGSQILTTSYG